MSARAVVSVVVLGAGATGSLFGARLAAAGLRVTLVGRPEHVRAIREGGLRLEGVGRGTYRVDAAGELPSTADAVLVTVKSFDLAAAARALGQRLSPTPSVLLGNGLGIEETAARAAQAAGWPRPEASLVRAVHTVPATWVGPGVVRATGTGEIVFPEPEHAGPAAEAARVGIDLFRRAGFVVRTSPVFGREVWRKAIVNAAINPVTALRGVLNGALAVGPARAEAETLLREALAVARSEGVDLPEEEVVRDLERVVRATAENRSSMLQDLDRGRPTEVDAISGEIVRRGYRHGVAVPATERVLREMERRRATGAAQRS